MVQGKCGVSKDRLGNKFGKANLMTGENLTEKCASVYVCQKVQKLFPSYTSCLVLNVRLDCILEDNMIHCKACTKSEIDGIVFMIRLLKDFVKEVGGELFFVNLGGTATKNIGKTLISKQILPSKRVVAKGYHMCNFVAKSRSPKWSYSDQQYDVTSFVSDIDDFFANNFNIERKSILRAFIADPRMRFVVDLDPKTKLEIATSREQRRAAFNKHRRDRYIPKVKIPKVKIPKSDVEKAKDNKRKRDAWNARSDEEVTKAKKRRQDAWNARTDKEIICEQKAKDRKKAHAKKVANKFVLTNTEQYTANKDILFPNTKTKGNPRQPYVEFVKYLKSKKGQYKLLRGYKDKAEYRLSIVKHFSNNGMLFFGYDKNEKIARVSKEWVYETMITIFTNCKR